jgi:cephalosporin-C deacetylase
MPAFDLSIDELKKYKGISPRPRDFDDYWKTALDELDTVDPNPELIPSSFTAKGVECFDLYFTGVRGARIHAKYLRPMNQMANPCTVHFHGYTMGSDEWIAYLPYVMQGMCVAGMDCRGQGGSSQDVGGVNGNTQRGHIIRGSWDSPQDLLYRHIFLDTVQLVRVLSTFQEVDDNRLATMGASQGGALSVACSALSGKIKRTVIQMPFLSDFKRTWQMGQGGNAYQEIYDYFRRFDPMHLQEDEFFERLGYIDIHFLAERIQSDVLMAIGLMDYTCIPSTQFAVFNAIKSKKELCLYPDFGHEPLPGFEDIAFGFLQVL